MKWPDDFINKVICGDCRKMMQYIPGGLQIAVTTDPVWPYAKPLIPIPGTGKAFELMAQANNHFIRMRIKRICIHLGCDSDPRFLSTISENFKFIRVFWLRYARPHYRGRVMYGADVAYFFGDPPLSRPGFKVIPGENTFNDSKDPKYKHPCPRRLGHVAFLISKCTAPDDIVLDPFCGTGTTLAACKQLGRKFIGIDISPEFCKEAEKRLSNTTPCLLEERS